MAKALSWQVIAFRLPSELVKRLDKHAERLRREQPGPRWTRADALRILLSEALNREEAK
jgi:predicted transcriptional regulator